MRLAFDPRRGRPGPNGCRNTVSADGRPRWPSGSRSRRMSGSSGQRGGRVHVKVVLCDINPKVVKAWQETFEENPEVEVVTGSILEQHASAWITPTNSHGRMDGGLDGVIKKRLGGQIEKKVQAA